MACSTLAKTGILVTVLSLAILSWSLVPHAFAETGISAGFCIHWPDVEQYADATYQEKFVNSGARWARSDVQRISTTEKFKEMYRTYHSLGIKNLGILNDHILPKTIKEKFTLKDWRDAVRATMTSYKGLLDAVEVWDEYDLPEYQCGYADGSIQHYYDMLVVAYEEVKAIDPSVPVVAGAVGDAREGGAIPGCCWGGELLKGIFRLGASYHCDVVSFHYYPWYTSESPAQVVERIHGITRKSVWITEFSAKYDAQPLTGYTEQTQADWLSRFLSSIYGATIKPQVAIWYIFHAPSPTTEEQPQCIIDHDYREKPAYNVFKKLTELATVQTVFTGADPVGFMLTGNIYDDAAMGWICAHRSSPKVLFPKTDATRVLPTGQPTWSDYAHLFAVGGRFANPTTKYYEDSGLAPLKAVANSNGTFFILRGSTLKLNVRLSSITASNDYFVVQVITDGVHKVVVLWGISAPGTYASGIYFDNRYLDIGSLTCGWHIVRWQDLNGNGVPENPSEFTILASGT